MTARDRLHKLLSRATEAADPTLWRPREAMVSGHPPSLYAPSRRFISTDLLRLFCDELAAQLDAQVTLWSGVNSDRTSTATTIADRVEEYARRPDAQRRSLHVGATTRKSIADANAGGVTVAFYNTGDRQEVTVEFSGYPTPHDPIDLPQIADMVLEFTEPLTRSQRRTGAPVLANVTTNEANQRKHEAEIAHAAARTGARKGGWWGLGAGVVSGVASGLATYWATFEKFPWG